MAFYDPERNIEFEFIRATGITDSALLPGVKLIGNTAITHSILMRARSQTVRYIRAVHNLKRKTIHLRSDRADHKIRAAAATELCEVGRPAWQAIASSIHTPTVGAKPHMRILFIFMLFCCGFLSERACAYEHFISPNHKFEAYTTANGTDGTGMKLFVRLHGSSVVGFLLAANTRWLDAKWSPDSRYLAVGNHSDGHISDIYVFGVSSSVTSPRLTVALYAHSPDLDTYDVQWAVAGWSLHRRDVLIKKTVKFQAVAGRERLHIPDKPLASSAWPRPDDA